VTSSRSGTEVVTIIHLLFELVASADVPSHHHKNLSPSCVTSVTVVTANNGPV
jgi:hypothetical protein